MVRIPVLFTVWLCALWISAAPAAATGNDTCGQQLSTPAPTTWSHVVWIVMENQNYGDIIGSPSAPYVNSLASKCGLATNFFSESHPSLPNYIAMTSGSTQEITDDASPSSHPLNVPSIFSQLPGGGSRSLEESMPSSCDQTDASPYAPRHNPEAYYTNLGSDCANYDVPLGASPDVSARFTFVTPNLCNDMHDCSVGTGDRWARAHLARYVAWARTSRSLLVVTFDEDDDTPANHIATVLVGPMVRPGTYRQPIDHYNVLRTLEDMYGLTPLGQARRAQPLQCWKPS
jgi:hypothetical protein